MVDTELINTGSEEAGSDGFIDTLLCELDGKAKSMRELYDVFVEDFVSKIYMYNR